MTSLALLWARQSFLLLLQQLGGGIPHLLEVEVGEVVSGVVGCDVLQATVLSP